MFRFAEQAVKVRAISERSEKHGKEEVPAQSVFFVMNVGNDALYQFDDALVVTLFRQARPRDGEIAMPLDEFTEIRFPWMGPISLQREFKGYQLRFKFGARDESDVLLNDVTVKGITFQPLEGGRVSIQLQCNIRPANEKEQGIIARLLKRECIISLLPPEVSPDLVDAMQADIKPPKKGRKPTEAQKNAAAAFEEHFDDPFAGSDLEGGAE